MSDDERLGFWERFLRGLVSLQVRRPLMLLLLAAALAAPAAILARGLELRTGFESLLPENKMSVRELRRVGSRTAGVSTLTIVADGSDKKSLQRFGDALVERLRKLGPEWVGTAEDGVQAEKEFLRRRKALFLSLEKVKELHDKIEDRYDYEVNGSITGEEPEPITRESIERELAGDAPPVAAKPGDKRQGRPEPKEDPGPPYPDGYYMDASAKRLVVLIRTPVETGDLAKIAELRRKVEEVVAETKPTSFDPAIKISYTGDLVTSAEQYGAVKGDLASVGAVGIAMILFVDFLFFLRIRAVLAMAIAIGIGVLWTFGITRLVIGHLNTASGFLVSIVFGNGINFGILFRARYGEERRRGAPLHDALVIAYRDTYRPTLTAAAAGAASYVSLATTDFRGFKHFGAIGGYGLLLCWLANYVFMAPLLVVFERAWPTFDAPSATGASGKRGLAAKIREIVDRGVPFGVPFAWVAQLAPRTVATVGLLLGLAGVALSVHYVKSDPLEYDTSKLGNDAVGQTTPAALLSEQVDEIVGRSGQDGMAVMTERVDQVKPLKVALEARRAAAAPEHKPFQKVVSIFDLVPDGQPEKVALLRDMRAKIDRVHELGKMPAKDWDELEPNLPPVDIAPFDVPELPERVARPFTEKDGTRGRIVYIVPSDGRSVRDVHYLLEWADSFRETRLPDGSVIHGSGRAVIFADMLQSVIEESPRAIVLSFFMTALVVVVAFARSGARGVGGRHIGGGALATILVLGSLTLGIAWMGGAIAVGDTRINFLNFIAVPITFGIGVDYAVNVVHRWRLEGPGRVVPVVRETGGAVVLCSLTTTLGYLALLTSINGAVRSFGLVAVIGEVTCLVAALVVLPAVLLWLERRRGVAVRVEEGALSFTPPT